MISRSFLPQWPRRGEVSNSASLRCRLTVEPLEDRRLLSVVLVQDGQPQATIILDEQPSETAQHAAQILQDIVQRMTGAELAIASEIEWSGQGNAIIVGMSDLAVSNGIDVNQDFDEGDHYVIYSGSDYVALVGNDDARPFPTIGEAYNGLRGSVYAVYDLLERWGAGWYGPDPIWQVVPKQETLSVPTLNVDERPAFLMRDNWIVEQHPDVMDAWRLTGRRIEAELLVDRYLIERLDA